MTRRGRSEKQRQSSASARQGWADGSAAGQIHHRGKAEKRAGRYETLLDMRMNNEIPKEVFSRKQQEVKKKIAELEAWIYI